MTEKDDNNVPNIENTDRRKAVKAIIGSITAISAYHILPSKWGTPIIEQVFLPAHAATSGSHLNPCSITHVRFEDNNNGYSSNWYFDISVSITPPAPGEIARVLRRREFVDGGSDEVNFGMVDTFVTDANGVLTLHDSTEAIRTGPNAITRVIVNISVDGISNTVSCSIPGPTLPF